MAPRLIIAPLLTGAALLFGSVAFASTWRVLPDSAELNFSTETDTPRSEEPVPFTGGFDAWTAEITFHPDALDQAELRIEVDMTSLTGDRAWAVGMARSADWLGVDAFPKAVFTARGTVLTEEGRYRFVGPLTLRDSTANVAIEADITLEGIFAEVSGSGELDRRLFGVGAFAGTELAAGLVTLDFAFSAIRTSYQPPATAEP